MTTKQIKTDVPGEDAVYKIPDPTKDEIHAGNIANTTRIEAEKQEKRAKRIETAAEKVRATARQASQTSLKFEDMTTEDIAEMNAFLDEKIKSLGTHSDDKEEAEDVNLIKKMVKKPALKDVVSESVMESFNVDKLSFVQTSPITSSLAESIAMVMEAKKKIGEYSEGEHTTRVYKLSGEHDEGDPYKVQLHKNGKHHEPSDYFTNDLEDAHGTAKSMVKHSAK